MPVILRPEDYDCWPADRIPPREQAGPLLVLMASAWPISKRVNSPKNDDADLLKAEVGESV